MKTPTQIILTICFSVLLGILPGHAQNGKFYSTEEGLSSSLINCLLQDHRGYIWVATEYGLNRFDGMTFTLYHHDKDPHSLPSNYIQTLFEDSRKRLYVGCINGLMVYRRTSDNFQKIALMKGETDVPAHVTRIVESTRGDIFIATTGSGLYKLDEQGDHAHYIDKDPGIEAFDYISFLAYDKDENLWIGTSGDGVLFKDNRYRESARKMSLPDNTITRIACSPQGEMFFGTLSHGLFRYRSENHSFVEVDHASSSGELAIISLANAYGQLLVGTDGQGLKTYNPLTKQLDNYETPSSPIDLKDAKVHAILEDRDGNLWLGLFQQGVVLLPKRNNPFDYYGAKSAYYNPIGHSCVMSVCSDSDGHLWVGTDHDGLYELDAAGKRLRHFAPDKQTQSVPGTIMCITEDHRGQLWLGSYGQGLACLDRKTGRCTYVPQTERGVVMAVAEAPSGELYLATLGDGIWRYRPDTHEWTHYKSSHQGKDDPRHNELANNWVNKIYIDRQGLLWMAHYTGVSCFNPATGSFLAPDGRNRVVEGCVGYALLEDHTGTLWAGTSQGLCRILPETGEHEFLTTDDGLCNNVVGGLCEDRNGHLWMSTFRGMGEYIPEEQRFVNFYAGDGLQGNEFTLGAFHQGADGKCYFGGVNGVTAFNPESIGNRKQDLHVWITDFTVDNRSVHSHMLSNGRPIIDRNVEDAEVFRLSYLDNSFGLTFSTLQYDNAEQIGYQYRMDGINSQWVTTEMGVNHIVYNKLPWGTYTFHVRALAYGYPSAERTVKIIIAAPWYRSWWAYTLYGLLLLLLLYGIYNQWKARTLHKRQLIEQKHAEELNEAKLQFFINISHEIRTPMTLIINPLEKLMAEEGAGERYGVYRMIYRNAQRILRLINQLMDVRKLDKGQMVMKFSEVDMVGFIGDVMQPFESLARKKEIRLQFVHPMEGLKVWVDLNNFDKILMNLLSNAFKFTPQGGAIDVRLQEGTDAQRTDALSHYFEITVEDSGMGIDEAQLDRIFDRFYQVDNSVNKAFAGTGVGLHLTRQLANLHHGHIHAENRTEHPGCRFVIRVPMGCAHLRPEEIENLPLQPAAEKPSPAPYLAVDDDPAASAPVYGESTRRSTSQPLLLIAEDDEEIAQYLRQELKKDYRITLCSNGKEAYASALRKQPDLIVSDVMMPEMDGFTLCRKLRQNTEVNHLPIILLTAKTRPEDTREGIERGADAYLTKPFSTDLLRTTITNLLGNRRLLRNKFSGTESQRDKVEPLEMKSADEQLLERIMKVINKHIDDPELSVEMLSTEVGISRVHIHRKLKELTNQTTRDFIKNIRLQQAAALMIGNEKLSVSDIAYKVGFSNLSHFSTSFKEKYGVSPKDYLTEKKTARDPNS